MCTSKLFISYFNEYIRESRMAQNYQLCLLVLIVVFLSQSACFALFVPGPDTSEQFFVIEGLGDGGTLGAGAETGILGNTGPDLSGLAAFFPLLLLAPLLLAATAPAAPAAPAPAPAPAPAAPSPSVTTQVLPTSTCVLECPATYMMLADTTISPNCYIGSGTSALPWVEALANCLRTPGAYLWRPNSESEANAVRNKLGIATDVMVWTGANILTNDGYSFIVENSEFLFTAPPFGTAATPAAGNDCVSIQLPATLGATYQWTAKMCTESNAYVCEVPPTCP
ncbi:uncharacterized protein LOC127715671 isoform X1 [Mytilus californianus]|uniref:uncharacterized protein LOC127715671 isoform X1 n=1 Tax=Mytilus californianus TaxID=6549 RepID=UPI0022472C2A|nr:uncharacterized protein LOC127715671 isoform X1 [Mytilus californianus]